MKTKEKDQK